MSKDLILSNYDYHLPKESIADRPMSVRHKSKLLVYKVSTDEVIHTSFDELGEYLPSDATLVMNQTKVFPCRLVGKRPSGGKSELFLLTVVPNERGEYHALIKMSRKKRVGDRFLFDKGLEATLSTIEDDGRFLVTFNTSDIESFLVEVGKIPIPPYIRGGESDDRDLSDYQTVYAKDTGSVAAPTAGLHFSPELFEKLEKKGVERAFVTLHVGLGTFAPVKEDDLRDHKMHVERYFVSCDNLEKIKGAKRVFTVGTTSLRVLESSVDESGEYTITPDEIYETDIFIHPGIEVKSIAGLITNFHLPKSTLLMLVSSLIGREKTLELYSIARDSGYRFFSYGDAMLIIR